MLDITEWCTANLHRTQVREREIGAECPWCGKFGAFNINRNSGAFRCYKCCDREDSYGRDLARLIAKVLELEIVAANLILRTGDEDERFDGDDAHAELPRIVRERGNKPLPKRIRVWHSLPESEAVYEDARKPQWMFPRYLKERGITREVARLFKLRTCFEGLYAGRLIMPMESPLGKTFTARAMDGDELRYRNPGDAGHRFMLYGLEHLQPGADLLIVEGPFDVLRQRVHGFQAIGLLGKELSREQEALLKALPRDTCITLMLDPEEFRSQYKIASRLGSHFESIQIAKLPMVLGSDGKPIDPGSCSRKQSHVAIRDAERWRGRRTSVRETVSWVREAREKLRRAADSRLSEWTSEDLDRAAARQRRKEACM